MDLRGGRLRMMSGIIYRLKRGFGLPITIQTETSNTVDLGSGRKVVTRAAVRVSRAIILPTQVHKEFKYDIGYLKANSNFTYGGLYTSGTREIIIDKNDLPAGFLITATDTMCVFHDHKRYAIKSVTNLEVPAYFLALEWTQIVPTYEIHFASVYDQLVIGESFEGEIDACACV